MVVPALFASGVAIAILTLTILHNRLPRRTNFAGDNIPTATGLIFIPIILLTMIAGGVVGLEAGSYLAYSMAACLVGFVDDMWGDKGIKGLRGHLAALRRRKATAGALKVLVLGGGAVVWAVVVYGVGVEAVGAAVILAGSVHVANLFDMRPGRAVKFVGVPAVALLFVVPGGAIVAVAGVLGGAAALFYFDLRGRIMLGDAGAAVLGATLGFLLLESGSGAVWWVAIAVVLGLTALAETSSISKVIQEVGALRKFDGWGRGDE